MQDFKGERLVKSGASPHVCQQAVIVMVYVPAFTLVHRTQLVFKSVLYTHAIYLFIYFLNKLLSSVTLNISS